MDSQHMITYNVIFFSLHLPTSNPKQKIIIQRQLSFSMTISIERNNNLFITINNNFYSLYTPETMRSKQDKINIMIIQAIHNNDKFPY